MWNFIPQLFYDFLARIVPGAIITVTSILVALGPTTSAEFVLNPPEDRNLFSFGILFLWILGSYLTGLILGQLWEISLGKITKRVQKQIELECKGERFAEHNRLQKAFDGCTLDIDVDILPPAFVMRDHLRYFEPSEAARLLKVRAERRSSQVLVLGFAILASLNAWYLIHQISSERVVLEVFLIVGIVAFWRMALRLHRMLVNGAIVSWLVPVSRGELTSRWKNDGEKKGSIPIIPQRIMKTTGLYIQNEFLSRQPRKETIVLLQILRIVRSLQFWMRIHVKIPKEDNSIFQINNRLELLFVLISIYKESIKQLSNHLAAELLSMSLSNDIRKRISEYNQWLSTWKEDEYLIVVDEIRNKLCFHLDPTIYDKYIKDGNKWDSDNTDLLFGIADGNRYMDFLFIEPSTVELNYIADVVPENTGQDKIDWVWNKTVEESTKLMYLLNDVIRDILKGHIYKKTIEI